MQSVSYRMEAIPCDIRPPLVGEILEKICEEKKAFFTLTNKELTLGSF